MTLECIDVQSFANSVCDPVKLVLSFNPFFANQFLSFNLFSLCHWVFPRSNSHKSLLEYVNFGHDLENNEPKNFKKHWAPFMGYREIRTKGPSTS